MHKTFLLLIFTSFISIASDVNDRNIILGTTNSDILTGGPAIDEIYGGTGNDMLNGGKGADFLYGGLGSDTFIIDVVNPSIDTVMDFNALEGDTVLINFENTTATRQALKIPKELGSNNVKINHKGEVKILLTNKKWLTFIKLKQPKLKLKVKDNIKNARLTFSVSF